MLTAKDRLLHENFLMISYETSPELCLSIVCSCFHSYLSWHSTIGLKEHQIKLWNTDKVDCCHRIHKITLLEHMSNIYI